MAQCEAERRKHPTMDLYVGIFNSKLYSSSKGNAHMGAADKRSRHVFNTFSGKVENVREDAPSSDRSSFQSRSFRNGTSKPPQLSDYGGSNGNSRSLSNVASTGDEMRSSIPHVGHGGFVEKSLASDLYKLRKMSSPQNDVVNDINHPQTNMNFGATDLHNGVRHAVTNVAHGLTDKSVTQMNVDSVSNRKNSLLADVGSGMEEVSSCSQVTVTGDQEHRPGSRITQNFVSEHAVSGLKATQIQKKTEFVTGMSDVTSDTNKQIDGGYLRGNGYARKSQEFFVSTGSSLLSGAGLAKTDKVQDFFSGRRSFSSSGEVYGLTKNDAEVMARRSVQSTKDESSGLALENVYTNRFQNQKVKEQNVGIPQMSGRGSSDMEGMPGEKEGESNVRIPKLNGNIKANTAEDVEGTYNELSLKDSPRRAHNLVANLRTGASASTDSSSSHGGSSHSGSPTAAENVRDNRVSSFGNILLSKGSPHSVSSRSMGSVNISGNCSLAPMKSNFFDSPASQFRYSTSSGRKSAELVPNRRHAEIVPNRKSSEIMSKGHVSGAAIQGSDGDGMFCTGNFSRGTGNMSNGANISLSNGSLLVGSANGNVLSVGGATKSTAKQGDVVNQASKADCTLLRKAQASLDPEEIKNAGNEYYRRGHFSEALILYTKAVSLSPSSAAYRSNRAAALSATGQLGEAVKECEDAIRLDSSYSRAHQRVAALYLRLGLMEKARRHVYAAGQQTDAMGVQQLHNIEEHISRCVEARKQGEWQNVIRESDAAVVAGADSAPLIFGYKSEALLGLRRPDEADGVCTAAQRVESSLIKSGILPADPFLLTVRAQIDMALGRFEGALEAAKSAAKIDPCNENVSALLRKAQTVCHSRTTGNELFKAGRFFEALALYAEGLESDPMNAVLLCNRAACRSKLGQWEKAVEDCDAAVRIQPNYMKALMRRANCWTKLERWEDALEDYELLRRKMPDDLEVARGLFDVQVALKKLQGEDTRRMKFGGDVEEVLSDEQFHEAITSPGLSVVQFVTKWSERCRQLAPFVDILCKRNPCVNFLRVDVEVSPYLAKSESVSFIPTFKIYKGGQKVKEIMGPTEQSLEYALKHYTM